jgi:hypothetical protein
MNNLIAGDRVKMTDFDYEGFNTDKQLHIVPYGSEGVITDIKIKRSQYDRIQLTIDFEEFGVHEGIYDYNVRKTKGTKNFNDRDRIKEAYECWVDNVTEECDWKTNISMNEVQGKYSELALHYALDILNSLEKSENQTLAIKNKIEEINNVLNGN